MGLLNVGLPTGVIGCGQMAATSSGLAFTLYLDAHSFPELVHIIPVTAHELPVTVHANPATAHRTPVGAQ